ncbi:hypothetical protein FB480_11044 [Agrobacterium vitis]|nr:hypothetical protein FB480_11044 [Agrobacterium vitis]
MQSDAENTGHMVCSLAPILHNSLNRNRFKEKIMQQIKNVTASFVRHIWRTAL